MKAPERVEEHLEGRFRVLTSLCLLQASLDFFMSFSPNDSASHDMSSPPASVASLLLVTETRF